VAAIAPNESIACGYFDDGHFLGPPASFMAVGDTLPEADAIIGLTVTIRTTCLYSRLGIGDALDTLPDGHIMRTIHVSTEGTKF
jgi:hypothetical protein